MNKIFEKDGKKRVVQDKGEETAAIFEGYKEVVDDKPATASGDKPAKAS